MFIYFVYKNIVMSYVVSFRIQKELKNLMDAVDIDWSREIRNFIEKRVREELKKKFLSDARELRRRIGVKSTISAAELIRRDREIEH